MFLTTQESEHHTFIMGTSGKGKSVYSDRARTHAREHGHLLVDTELFREGGLKPFEYEYARRIQNGIYGQLPRALNRKAATFISDVSRSKKRKRPQKHLVTTKNGFTLDRKLVSDAQDELESISGIWLNQNQLIELMEDSVIDEMLHEFGEAETQIREHLAEALSMKLLGRSWPQYGSLQNKVDKSETDFSDELNSAAQAYGYKVRF